MPIVFPRKAAGSLASVSGRKRSNRFERFRSNEIPSGRSEHGSTGANVAIAYRRTLEELPPRRRGWAWAVEVAPNHDIAGLTLIVLSHTVTYNNKGGTGMSIATRVSTFNRTRKWDIFLSQVRPTPEMTVLDVGYTEKEFSPMDNFIEKNYPHPANITALGVSKCDAFTARYPMVKTFVYDGKHFPFTDKSFDVCWSNAVLEHVGDAERQLGFLKEIVRVSKRAFITTPNRLFPIEVHTRTPLLHMLPKVAFDGFLRATGKSWAAGDYMNLLTEGSLRGLLGRSGARGYQLFKNRLGGFTLDFAVMIEG
jgi:SAM-dependent methyltransferase